MKQKKLKKYLIKNPIFKYNICLAINGSEAEAKKVFNEEFDYDLAYPETGSRAMLMFRPNVKCHMLWVDTQKDKNVLAGEISHLALGSVTHVLELMGFHLCDQNREATKDLYSSLLEWTVQEIHKKLEMKY